MAQLGASELRTALDVIADVGDAVDLDDFARRATSGLFSAVGCDIVSYNEMDPVRFRALTVAMPEETLFADAEQILARHLREHPVVMHYATTGSTEVRALSDFITSRQLHRTGLYAELYRRIRGEFLVAVPLPLPKPVVAGFGLFRMKRDFAPRERAFLAALQPYLARAYRGVLERVALGALEAAIEDGERSVVLLGRGRRPVYATPGTETRFRRWFGSGNGLLPSVVETWLANGANDYALTDTRNGSRISVTLVSEAGQDALVVVESRATPAPERLRELGLSPREAEVLAAAAEGRTNDDIARILSVSPRTVKKHLESIYDKLGVRTRTAAAAVAMRTG